MLNIKSNKLFISLLIIFAVIAVTTPEAYASSSSTGLDWEGPLMKFANSIKGPVAFVLCLLGLIVSIAVLLWGGELSDFTRKFIILILVISTIGFAANILSNLFGIGATIPLKQGIEHVTVTPNNYK